MTGEEISGPAGPKAIRLLYFVGAGFICVAAINKWRELERKSLQEQQHGLKEQSPHDPANAVPKAID
ncbi:hypothetical protein ACJRO7_025138 [Eucalyptus globulus]|uniref:Transmembrane protein n=1 Tax=Eucalyptus globulus TaxID=34317 RepID=A0ABD3KB02_EUCGL